MLALKVKLLWEQFRSDSNVTNHSVARQCVHCCKGNAASQWEMAILVSELRNPWTDWL